MEQKTEIGLSLGSVFLVIFLVGLPKNPVGGHMPKAHRVFGHVLRCLNQGWVSAGRNLFLPCQWFKPAKTWFKLAKT